MNRRQPAAVRRVDRRDLRDHRGLLGLLLVVLAFVVPVRAQATHNFLWKVTRQQGVIYLAGSIHLLSQDFYPLSPALEAAFNDSDLLVEEINLDDAFSPEGQATLLRRGMLSENQTLDKVVTPATYQLVTARLAALGMPVEPLKRFKPWSIAVMLDALEWEKAGFDPTLGLDRHFHDLAKVDAKGIQGLETVDFQLSLLDDLTPAQQDRMLAEGIKTIDTEQASIRTLTTAWKTGDTATIERVLSEETKDDPEMNDRLLTSRNRAWLPKLEALFSRQGHAFVVVGAAHLVGPEGILASLKAKGYQIEQQ